MSNQVQQYILQASAITPLEKIVFHLQHREGYEKIDPELEQRLHRMQQCRDYLQIYASRFTVIPMLERDFGISKAQAYRLFNDTLEVFNVMAEPKGRDMWIDLILGKVFNTYQRATGAGDYKTALYCMKQAKEIIREFYGDQEAKMYEQIQPPVWLFGFFPELSKTPVPDNLNHQVEDLLKDKRKKNLTIDHVEEAKIIEDNNADQNGETTC